MTLNPNRRRARWMISGLLALTLIVPFRQPAPVDLAVAINQLRYEQGLPYLAGDWTLDRYAQTHASRMASVGLHHSAIWTLLDPWVGVGENVGAGTSIWQIIQAMKLSPTHWGNITGRWTHMGVGLVDDGQLWVVVVFTR